jgi:hypothetical protein
MSKIKFIPGIHWSPAAALSNALEDSDNMKSVFILSVMNDNTKEVRSANLTNDETLWILMNEVYRILKDNNV